MPGPSIAAVLPEPTDTRDAGSVIQEKITHTLAILRDTAMQKPAAVPALRKRLIEELEPLFIFREMTVRALGTHARELKADQVDTLAGSFKRLLERVYIDRLTANLVSAENPYKVEDIQITRQEVIGNYARINSKARISKNADETDLLMNYRMVKRDGKWYVYDLEIEGISLIENYRAQFNEVLTNKSFDDLVASIEKNLREMDRDQKEKPKEQVTKREGSKIKTGGK